MDNVGIRDSYVNMVEQNEGCSIVLMKIERDSIVGKNASISCSNLSIHCRC